MREEEVTELLDITPARLFRRRIVCPKFRRKHLCELAPVVAVAPVTPLVGGLPAAQVSGLIGELYRIEAELREKKPGPAFRESERARRSSPIVRRLGKIFGILGPSIAA